MYNCLFEHFENDKSSKTSQGNNSPTSSEISLDVSDHTAVISVHTFLQNLYFYATQNNDLYRHYLLEDTLLIPRLILPYLSKSVQYLTNNDDHGEVYSELVKGIAASIRTLILATFVRAPYNQFMSLLVQYNPTIQILKTKSFCVQNEYIYSLLCLLNVNIGAFDLSGHSSYSTSAESDVVDNLLYEFAYCFNLMDEEKQIRVCKRVMYSGAVPVMRDTPSYAKIVSVLMEGGSLNKLNKNVPENTDDDKYENNNEKDYILKLQLLKENNKIHDNNNGVTAESKDAELSAFEIASAVASLGNARLQDFKTSSRDNKATDNDNLKSKNSALLGNI